MLQRRILDDENHQEPPLRPSLPIKLIEDTRPQIKILVVESESSSEDNNHDCNLISYTQLKISPSQNMLQK